MSGSDTPKAVASGVEHEWDNTRFLLQSPLFPAGRGRALEFGCSYGASAIMLAGLGWRVTGIDVNEKSVAAARRNVASYGTAVEFAHVPDSRHLPFPDASFELICANSVLEYIYPRALLPEVYREMDRVLKPGGILFIAGTSNRLLPREAHSHHWFINYAPASWLERIRPDQRRQWGLWPWQIRRAFPAYRDLLRETRGAPLLQAKKEAGWSAAKVNLLRLLNAAAGLLGTSVGALLPSICFILQKPVLQHANVSAAAMRNPSPDPA